MSFETEAQLSIEIPQSELRNARQQIESEIGTTEIGVTDGGSMSAQTSGGSRGGRERRRRRREYRWARERTDYLEEITAILYDIEDEVGGDSGLTDLLGGGALGGLLGGAGGIIGEAGGGLATGVGSGIGSAVGTAVGNAIADETLSLDEDALPLEIDQEPLPLALDDEHLPLDLDDELVPLALDDELLPLEVDAPSSIGVDDPSPLEVSDPSPLTVEDVPPLEIEDPPEISVTVETSRRSDGTPTGGTGGSGREWDTIWDRTRPSREDAREDLRDIPMVGDRVADADRRIEEGINNWRERVFGSGNRQTGGTGGGAVSGGGGPTQPTIEQISVSQTFDMEVVVERIREVTNALDDIENQLDDAYSELEGELDDVNSRIDRLEREISRG